MEAFKMASLLTLLAPLAFTAPQLNNKERDYWVRVGRRELEMGLERSGGGVAKNVILFIGDGMGTNTITASRIHKANEETTLSFESFPNLALIKTYSVDRQVPESAGTATAMFSGVKSKSNMLGLSPSVDYEDCEASLHPGARLESIMTAAQRANKATGFVTTTRVSHATPAALYAHSPNRKWECRTPSPPCRDIAYQLVHYLPGANINVVLGGGRQTLVSHCESKEGDPLDLWGCRREDGLDLIQDWIEDKKKRDLRHAFVNSTHSLAQIDPSATDYLLGIFSNGHMRYEGERDKGANGSPSLQQMTLKALQILSKNNNGFLLVVEGGMIDQAHHRGEARRALEETLSLDDAVDTTLRFLSLANIIRDTLLIVTADHSHTLTINGPPPRGNNILGLAGKSMVDGVSYTTLSYGTGGGGSYHYNVSADGREVVREDPSKLDTTSYQYRPQAAIKTDENKHGGSDVPLYATGPCSNLFYKVHEQNYIGWVIRYAARIGEFSSSGPKASVSLFLLPLAASSPLLL